MKHQKVFGKLCKPNQRNRFKEGEIISSSFYLYYYLFKKYKKYGKNVIRLTESQLKNIIKESVKKVLKEGTETLDDMKEIINTIDVDMLIKKGKVEIGDYDIERLSNPMDMTIRIKITNVETGQSAEAKMYSDEYASLSDEHYEVVKMACSEYLKLNR